MERNLKANGICVAVQDLDATAAKFAAAFGQPAGDAELDESPGVEAVFRTIDLGGFELNLMADSSGTGPVARFLGRRGEGLYSLLVEVDDLTATVQCMRDAGVSFVEDEPRRITHLENGQTREVDVAWTRPNSFGGLLVELQQYVD